MMTLHQIYMCTVPNTLYFQILISFLSHQTVCEIMYHTLSEQFRGIYMGICTHVTATQAHNCLVHCIYIIIIYTCISILYFGSRSSNAITLRQVSAAFLVIISIIHV